MTPRHLRIVRAGEQPPPHSRRLTDDEFDAALRLAAQAARQSGDERFGRLVFAREMCRMAGCPGCEAGP